MELTKDNVVITSDGDIFIPVIGFRDIKSRLPQGKELKQQIVDDYEKSRKWDELQSRYAHIDFGLWLQDTKLRELVERQKTNTEAILRDASPNKEELQRLLNLFDYLLKESEK